MESEREGGEGRRGLAVRGLEGGREPKLASPLCANSYSSSTPATRLPLQPDPPIQIHLRHWSITLVTDTATKRSHRTPLVRHTVTQSKIRDHAQSRTRLLHVGPPAENNMMPGHQCS